MSPRPVPIDARVARSGERRFRDHYAASQFRIETWNELKHADRRGSTQPDDADRDIADAARSRRAHARRCCDEIEHYWAFPGKRACDELRSLLERGWYRVARAPARRGSCGCWSATPTAGAT